MPFTFKIVNIYMLSSSRCIKLQTIFDFVAASHIKKTDLSAIMIGIIIKSINNDIIIIIGLI